MITNTMDLKEYEVLIPTYMMEKLRKNNPFRNGDSTLILNLINANPTFVEGLSELVKEEKETFLDKILACYPKDSILVKGLILPSSFSCVLADIAQGEKISPNDCLCLIISIYLRKIGLSR